MVNMCICQELVDLQKIFLNTTVLDYAIIILFLRLFTNSREAKEI